MATTYENVGVSLGRPITDPTEQAQITQWISDAELQIRLRLGDLTLLDQDALDFVVREAVAMRVRNPEGYQSETVDDYTYRWGDTAGRIAILDEWWDMLSPSSSTAAFSIQSFGEADTTSPDVWQSTTERLYP